MDKQQKPMVLVTHSGKFHADEVFAYVILLAVFINHILIRSRKKEDWEKGDIVFDVGGGKFDHHGVDKVYRENDIPYASFGLIWREYGKQYLTKWFKEHQIEEAHKMIDVLFVQGIDALDNGIDLLKDSPIKVNSISDLIEGFSHLVDADVNATPETIAKKQDMYFLEATKLAKQVLENEIVGVANILRAKETIVKKAFEERQHKALVVLEKDCPWEEAIWELDKEKEVLFVVYPKPDGHYIQVVRKNNKSFDARKDLPKEWAGKRDEKLGNVIGIEDAIFCHSERFLAGAVSKESILKMAEIALMN